MKAILKQYRQSPRKVRLVADSVRGKSVERALVELKFTAKRASATVEKLIKSAVNNAKNTSGLSEKDLFIKEIRVDEGVTMKRMMPRSRGRGFRINKRTSHITLELGEKHSSKKPIPQVQGKQEKNGIKKEAEKKSARIVKKEKVLKKKK
jgi:large subunit ribosomal protein L22